MRVSLRKRGNLSGFTYYVDYYIGRKRFRRSLETSNKAEANAKCIELQHELLHGVSKTVFEKRSILVSQLAQEYFAATVSRRRPRTNYEENRRMETSILPAFGNLRLCDVTLRHAEVWISTLSQRGLSPGSINRHITTLKAMFNRAVEWEYLPKSPLRKLRKLKESKGSTRFLSECEAEKILSEAQNGPDYLYPIILIALHTGLRRGEILRLQWKDFDFERNEILVESTEEALTKSGRSRFVPMTKQIREYFYPRRGIGFLFVNTEGKPLQQLDKSFHAARERAKVPHCRFHDLRHTYASHMAMQKVPQRTLQELLGHESGRMTERYSHLSSEHKHEAVKQFSLGFSPSRSVGHAMGTQEREQNSVNVLGTGK